MSLLNAGKLGWYRGVYDLAFCEALPIWLLHHMRRHLHTKRISQNYNGNQWEDLILHV